LSSPGLASGLASFVNERFWGPVRASIFRFLHLVRRGTIVPTTITRTAHKIKIHKEPAAALCVAGAAAGVLAASEDEPAAASGVVGVVGVTAALLSASAEVLATGSGVVGVAAGFAGGLRECFGDT
jgi:hypothetical protein